MIIDEKAHASSTVPFIFPKGMVLVEGDGTRNDKNIISNEYVYTDNVNGIKRLFKAREVRYKNMDTLGLHPQLRGIYITYSDGFKIETHECFLMIGFFNDLINNRF